MQAHRGQRDCVVPVREYSFAGFAGWECKELGDQSSDGDTGVSHGEELVESRD